MTNKKRKKGLKIIDFNILGSCASPSATTLFVVAATINDSTKNAKIVNNSVGNTPKPGLSKIS